MQYNLFSLTSPVQIALFIKKYAKNAQNPRETAILSFQKNIAKRIIQKTNPQTFLIFVRDLGN